MTRPVHAFRPQAIALALSALAAQAMAQQAAPGTAPAPTPANAASAPAAAASAPAKAEAARGEQALETVTITATRRAERLQDVPLSVTTATPEQIESAGVQSIADIAKVVSGVTFGESPQDAGFRVRGVGTLGGFASASEQPVGVVIDSVVMGLGPTLDSMADVERIEALKGPQGTQFGKNASSGVISIITRRPKLGVREGAVSASVGSGGDRMVNGTFNMPLGEIAAARITAFDRQYDGYLTNIARNETWGGNHIQGLRAKVLFKPSEALDVLLSADGGRRKQDGPQQMWTLRRAPAVGFTVPAGVTPSAENETSAENARSFDNYHSAGGSVEVNYRLGEYTLTSVTAHRQLSSSRRFGLDQRPTTVFEGGGSDDRAQDSQELRITSPRGRIEYVAGVFWSRLQTDFRNSAWLQPSLLGAPAPPGLFTSISNGLNHTETDTRSTALFSDGKFKISDTVSVLAGLRFTHDSVLAVNTTDPTQLTGETGSPPGFLVPPTARPTQIGETAASKPSGRLGMEWKPARDTLLYATVARGYLGPTVTFSGQTGTRSNVAAQTVDDITLGFKTQLLDRKVTLNGSVFMDTYKNLQVGVFRQATNEFVTENAGGMRAKGFELDLSARMGGGFTGRTSLTYTDVKFTEYVTQCPATGDRARCYTSGTTSLFQAAGSPLPGAPKVTAVVGLDYSKFLDNGYVIDASVNASYRSKTYFGVGETDTFQPEYSLVNAAVKISPESEKWHIGLWGRNLFDKHYQSAVIGLPFAPPGGIVNWTTRDAHRAVGVTVGAKF